MSKSSFLPSESDLSRAEVLVLDVCSDTQTSSGSWASWKLLVKGEMKTWKLAYSACSDFSVLFWNYSYVVTIDKKLNLKGTSLLKLSGFILGEPPIKRQLLLEFNRTKNSPRSLKASKSTPDGNFSHIMFWAVIHCQLLSWEFFNFQ